MPLQRVKDSFERQGMMRHLGARLLRVAPGLCELALPYSDKVTQQQDGFHGGAMGALADIAGGYAGLTVLAPDMEITTAEVVHIDADGKQSLCAVMQQTLVPVAKTY